MIVVLGVGNFLHGDDGAGPAVAAGVLALGLPGVSAFDCGTAPENFTGVVRRLHPDLLVVADAADMGLPAGSVRRIPVCRIHDTAIGTHMMALSHLVQFLADAAEEITGAVSVSDGVLTLDGQLLHRIGTSAQNDLSDPGVLLTIQSFEKHVL